MKLLAKIAAIAASAALAASAFGCGSSDTATKSSNPGFEPQTIEVNNPGFVITDEGMLRYAFVAVNPNEGHVAQDVVFTVEAYDASGSMIAGGSESIPVLYPGAETAGAGETELFSQETDTPEVANLSIVALMDSVTWADTTMTADDLEAINRIVNPRLSEADDSLDIKASIEMSTGDDAPASMELRALALLFNESGQAICGTDVVTFSLSQDEPDYDFNSILANAPAYDECNLYVTPNAIL